MFEVINVGREHFSPKVKADEFVKTLDSLEVGQGFVIPLEGVASRRVYRHGWQLQTGKRASIKRHTNGWLVVRTA